MASHRLIIFRCLLLSFLGCHMTILQSTFIHLAVPLMKLYNKTSGDLFGIYDDGVLFLSICSWTTTISIVTSLVLVVPLMDLVGRKFVSVYLKSALSFVSALFMLSAWYFQSAILFIFGEGICCLLFRASNIADSTYMVELAPENYKGSAYGCTIIQFSTGSVFFDDYKRKNEKLWNIEERTTSARYLGTCAVSIPLWASSLLMLVLSREDVFGTEESWWIIIVISQIFNIAFLFVGSRMECTDHLRKSSTVTKFLRNHSAKTKDVFSDWSIGKMVLLLTLVQSIFSVSVLNLEVTYPIQTYAAEGVTANEVFTMNLISELVMIPYSWLGPMTIDKMSRRNFVLLMELVLFVKTAIHSANVQFQTLYLAYVNSFLHRMVAASGLTSLSIIMTDEVVTREYVVIAGQISVGGGELLSGLISGLAPFLLLHSMSIFYALLAAGAVVVLCAIIRLLPSTSNQNPEKKKLLP